MCANSMLPKNIANFWFTFLGAGCVKVSRVAGNLEYDYLEQGCTTQISWRAKNIFC